jgi:hypothetical protein
MSNRNEPGMTYGTHLDNALHILDGRTACAPPPVGRRLERASYAGR